MFAAMRAGLRYWKAKGEFTALPAEWREVVFYSEDAGSWPHLGPVVAALSQRGQKLTYVTSSPDEPILRGDAPGVDLAQVTALCIGAGATRTAWFMALDAKQLVMTMPDLETLHIKRSRAADVHYTYVFHSMVSTHMIYRPDAFDHFDTLLTVGPHHVAEIRARETHAGLSPKRLVPHGYARLEAIRADAPRRPATDPAQPRHVLVAPSWGPDGLLENHADTLVRTLLDAGLRVTVRPHPVTSRDHAALLARVMQAHACDRLALDQDMRSRASLLDSDLMISDWSGAALEYAFGLDKPVLFVDVPRKVRNADYAALGIEPLEVSVRAQVGRVVAVDALAELPTHVAELCADPAAFADEIGRVRAATVSNLGRSAEAAADEIQRIARGELAVRQPAPATEGA